MGLRIVSTGATDQEIAAVSAVLQTALAELAAAQSPHDGPVVSAWQRSQRGMREPLVPGPGAWRSF
jgi:hypothetical protein